MWVDLLYKLIYLGARIAESEVKYPTPTFPKFPTPDSGLSKISDSRLLNIKGMKFSW